MAADEAHGHPSLRACLRRRGTGAVVPTKSNQRASPRFDKAAYRERSLVERCVGRLKEHRRVATRYERLAKGCLAMLTLAAILTWV